MADFGIALIAGLSPRGRGKHPPIRCGNGRRRSIPAWAGETQPTRQGVRLYWVYPRVGGGNPAKRCSIAQSRGLSPRGRGKPHPGQAPKRAGGSIPAWAGETLLYVQRNDNSRVYPRVGGGNIGAALRRPLDGGLSPRGRGKRAPFQRQRTRAGSIPAWAGETIGRM